MTFKLKLVVAEQALDAGLVSVRHGSDHPGLRMVPPWRGLHRGLAG